MLKRYGIADCGLRRVVGTHLQRWNETPGLVAKTKDPTVVGSSFIGRARRGPAREDFRSWLANAFGARSRRLSELSRPSGKRCLSEV